MKKFILLLTFFCVATSSFAAMKLKAFNIDYNWDKQEGRPSVFAAAGKWSDADPAEIVDWHEKLGCNAIHSFGVSCNGYAWYKNGFVPEQPNLKHDFLTEVVKIARAKNISVFAYFCVGANTKWGLDNPDLSYGTPCTPHIPFTLQYIDYLCKSIKDTIEKTDVDGVMLDWIWTPAGNAFNGSAPRPLKWLECERKMFAELMNKDFPADGKPSKEDEAKFRRLSIERLWAAVYKTIKQTKPNCLIWITNENITNPDVSYSKMFSQTDWLMNENGKIEVTNLMRKMVKPDAQLITCLASWNKQNAFEVAKNAMEKNINLYGYTKPTEGYTLKPVKYYLEADLKKLSGDELNIAILARVFNNLPLEK